MIIQGETSKMVRRLNENGTRQFIINEVEL